MNILSQPRRGGKSYECIMKAHEVGGVIVCATEIEADRIKRMADDMGVSIPKPISCINAREKLAGRIEPILVDNLDWILLMWLGREPIGSTINGPTYRGMWDNPALWSNKSLEDDARAPGDGKDKVEPA